MARIQFDGEGETRGERNVSKPVKRMRWASQHITGQSALRKRMSVIKRLQKRSASTEEKEHSEAASPSASDQEAHAESESQPRTVYVNVPLPEDARDENGHVKKHFGRNKIRTSKYTPLSFIPKNLWFQFHNIANVYFLFIIILGIFSIFGQPNPGLAAVPLIVILFITAVKDAVEDWRRTVLDNELNNSPIHRLVDWENVNTSEDNVSAWRRVKKSSTKFIISCYRIIKNLHKRKFKKGQGLDKSKLEGRRLSTDTRPSIRASVYSNRTSFHSTRSQQHRSDIPLAPVSTPDTTSADQSQMRLSPGYRPGTAFSFEDHGEHGILNADPQAANAPSTLRTHEPASAKHRSGLGPVKNYGSILNTSKATPEKARFKRDYWKNVQVGDFVRIYNEEQIPADVVILSTSDPDGACYIETKNLDGETNLKVRQALHAGRKVKHARDCEKAEFVIDSEGPHPNLYQYSGVVRWKQMSSNTSDADMKEMAEPIGINNLLLRGCSLKNTEWVLGVVVFTGPETKIMLNSGITPSKRARIAKDLNWNVIYNFIILFFMCLVSGIVQGVTWAQGNNSLDYFEYGSIGGNPALDGLITFWSAIILFQNLVPISLYITLEIIRSLQAFFIYSDVLMYYEKLNYPCTPKSWNISDDLGQIEYIFSDKTGTLTQNVMEFKKCTINGIAYGEAYTEAQAGMQKRQGVNVDEQSAKIHQEIARDRVRMLADLRKIHNNPYLRDEDLTFVAPLFVADLNGQRGEEQKRANEHFMIALALCHTVITERTAGDPPKIEFKAQSPDEAALVATARDCGFTVLGRSDDDIHLNIMGEDRTYQVLNTLEFNSTRKRMSAIIRMPDGRIKLFCKGADSMIYSRLVKGLQQPLRKATAEHLETFAREGLRTLCIAERDLSEDEYQAWSHDHDIAAYAIQDRDAKLEEVSDRIERDLVLLGGTAIEDRLQDGVPETIALLGDAGIKLWVLTGDKVETAINIGFSCNLLSNEMDLIVFNVEEGHQAIASDLLDRHLQDFGLTGSDEELAAARLNHQPPAPTHAIVIDGESLKLVLHDELRQRFLLLCKQCKSVLCCRVSPAQKAAVVQLVKNGLDVMALSIGDGANDVAMIQEADVGVGIAGEEGRQAVMSSDYAIGQFRFLQRLVLVHGRWSYRRMAETVANFFYKNLVWTLALFWYQIYNNFDVTYLFEYTYILLVNVVFTSLPVIVMGILDQDVSDKVSLAVPQLYRRGMERKEWTQTKFWVYMFDGAYQSVICFFMGYLLFAPAIFATESGRGVDDTTRMGVYVACATIAVVNMYVLLNTYRWDWLMLLIVALSTLLIWFWTGVYSSFQDSFRFYQAAREVYGTLTFWTLTLLIIIVCLLPRFSAKFIQKNFFPRDIDIIREQIRLGKFNYLDGLGSAADKSGDTSTTSSELAKLSKVNGKGPASITDSERPLYPPSETTAKTRNPRSQNSSDGTDRTKPSLDLVRLTHDVASTGPVRSSYERARQSMDRLRPSFEGSRDFTSAALLTRVESSHSHPHSAYPITPSTSRIRDITSELQ